MSDFKISSDGQVTLPPDVRRFLKLRPGDAVHFEIRSGAVILLPSDIEKTPEPLFSLEQFQQIYKRNLGDEPSHLDSLRQQREARGWDETDDKLFEVWEKEIVGKK